MGDLLERRRNKTDIRIAKLRTHLRQAERLCKGKACVYAIGSFGRYEATLHSDLDLFIVGERQNDEQRLKRLDEIRIKADLIQATRKLQIPDFSGDGEYLVHYTTNELVKNLGQRQDDTSNTLTARLLLLLESRPLLETAIYRRVIRNVIKAYWRDYDDHKPEFMPAYLANDILRLWRTFCVNYEAQTAPAPPRKKAKRKLKNYKLKHSRLLTCYSALLYLLTIFSERETVSPADAFRMAELTPTGRLEWLLAQSRLADIHPEIGELLATYEEFLKQTDASEDVLIERFLKESTSRHYFETGNKLGDLVFRILEGIGRKNRFHRILLV